MAGLNPVYERECGQTFSFSPAVKGDGELLAVLVGFFVLVSFTGVVLLSINNHWSRSCS